LQAGARRLQKRSKPAITLAPLTNADAISHSKILGNRDNDLQTRPALINALVFLRALCIASDCTELLGGVHIFIHAAALAVTPMTTSTERWMKSKRIDVIVPASLRALPPHLLTCQKRMILFICWLSRRHWLTLLIITVGLTEMVSSSAGATRDFQWLDGSLALISWVTLHIAETSLPFQFIIDVVVTATNYMKLARVVLDAAYAKREEHDLWSTYVSNAPVAQPQSRYRAVATLPRPVMLLFALAASFLAGAASLECNESRTTRRGGPLLDLGLQRETQWILSLHVAHRGRRDQQRDFRGLVSYFDKGSPNAGRPRRVSQVASHGLRSPAEAGQGPTGHGNSSLEPAYNGSLFNSGIAAPHEGKYRSLEHLSHNNVKARLVKPIMILFTSALYFANACTEPRDGDHRQHRHYANITANTTAPWSWLADDARDPQWLEGSIITAGWLTVNYADFKHVLKLCTASCTYAAEEAAFAANTAEAVDILAAADAAAFALNESSTCGTLQDASCWVCLGQYGNRDQMTVQLCKSSICILNQVALFSPTTLDDAEVLAASDREASRGQRKKSSFSGIQRRQACGPTHPLLLPCGVGRKSPNVTLRNSLQRPVAVESYAISLWRTCVLQC
jgi:hypothetical protein